MADFSRHDNLIWFCRTRQHPVAIVSLGVVPADIPGGTNAPINGWEIKSRGLTRGLAFWLNQGARFVLLHSAYEGQDDINSHALLPYMPDPGKFRWQESLPLTTLKRFTDALAGAKKLDQVANLSFRYHLADDVPMIPGTGQHGPLMASDLVALLSYQLTPHEYAVAACVVTPNQLQVMPLRTLTVEVDRRLRGKATYTRPSTGAKGDCRMEPANAEGRSRFSLPVGDDVTWIRFAVR
jgi:hypothetical protein